MIALTIQLMIEPARRTYDDAHAARGWRGCSGRRSAGR